ncbi:MAG: YqaA family protein [Gammaproteobacteria bacterium]
MMGVLGFWFEDEMSMMTNWVVDRIGFTGLCLILLVTDTLVTPFLPDILLVVIAKSALAERGLYYVFILGTVSVFAGMLGWNIGRGLGQFNFIQRLYGQIGEEQRGFMEKYGFWAIVLGAITPLPYSFTCWTAGVMGLRWTKVLAASVLFRIPRIIIYYLLIASTVNLSDRSWRIPQDLSNVHIMIPMEFMSFFIIFPIGALLIGCIFLVIAMIRRRVIPYITAGLWFLYGIYEGLMYARVLCTGECNIRVDLLLIYPVLILASILGIISALRKKATNQRDKTSQ